MKIKLTRQNIESALLYSIAIYLLWAFISTQILLYRWSHGSIGKQADANLEKYMDNLKKSLDSVSDNLLKKDKNDTSTKN